MNILNAISHWPKVSVDIYEETTTNSAGIITKVWTKTATVKAWKYESTSGLTDQAGKLQIVDMVTFVFDPAAVVNEDGETFDKTNPLRFDHAGVQHFIESKKDILANGQVYEYKGRRDAA